VETRDQNRLVVATRDAGLVSVAEPRNAITKTVVSVAIRPEKVKLSRRGPVSDVLNARAINRLEGIVTDVSYLGGITTYKVKLDSGAVVRSSMANTARIDIDAYAVSQRVVAWFTPDDCVVLEQ
jgi:putrescine transport system ATP-binding protein